MDYAATFSVEAPTEEVVDAFEDALDALSEAVLVGNVESGRADLTFTIAGSDVLGASMAASLLLLRHKVPVPDNARLRVERLGVSDSASLTAETVRRHQKG